MIGLTVLGAALAVTLLLHHFGEGSVAAVCGEGGGCDAVSQSPYATIAGVPLASFGLAAYLALAAWLLVAVVVPDRSRLPMAGAAFFVFAASLGFDVWLLGLQAFQIGEFCSLCLATYGVNLAACAVLWPARSAFLGLGALRGDGSGRVALVGGVLSAFAFGSSIVGITLALSERSAGREGALLGEQATRMKEALDDPQKFEQYQQEKSVGEFDAGEVLVVDYAGVPRKGDDAAPISIVEYSDFLCPYCRSLASAFDNYLPASGGRVKLFFKHYPLDPECNSDVTGTGHAGSCGLARGVICADAQERFWEYHDAIFAKPLQKPGEADLKRFAREVGLDSEAFSACLAAKATRQRLAADIDEGRRFGITSTPTVLVNGKRLPRLNDLTRIVDHESGRLGLAVPENAAGHEGHDH